jgi:hypothetical protein
MRVQVDEPRRGDEIAEIDNARSGFGNGRRDTRNRIAAYGYVGTVPRAPGAIHNTDIAHYQVVGLRLCTTYAC